MSDLPAGFVLDKKPAARAVSGAATLPPGFTMDEPGSATEALWQGLLHGAGNIFTGAKRLGVRAIGGDAASSDQAAQERQRAFEQQPTVRAHPIATATGETLGEMGATVPLGIGRGLAPLWEKLLTGGLSGAAGGALGAASQAPGGQRFMPAVGQGAAMGAAVGAPMSAAGSAVRPSSLAAPRVSPAAMVRAPEAQSWRDAARMLVSQGVRLSPGQARNVGYKERSLQEWPILRNFVRGAVGNSVDDFNRATVSQALSPIGVIVPRNVRAGHDLMDFGQRQLTAAYDRVLPNLTLNRQGVTNWIQNDPELAKVVGSMADEDIAHLSRLVQTRVFDKFDQSGAMDGRTFKTLESDLADRANRMRGTNRDEVGHALSYVLSGIRDELQNQNPTHAADLQKINNAFSMWARVRAAAVRDPGGRSRFTPRDLLQTLKGEDPSSGQTSFGRGREPMQAFAEAGQEIIQPSIGVRTPFETKSATRMLGDVVGGATGAIPYAAARGLQAIPGAGVAPGVAAPGIGAEAGTLRTRRQRKIDDVNPPPSVR